MNEISKVVAHLLDGSMVKGTTRDFFPDRAMFHVQPMDGTAARDVYVRDLKALFFVRDLQGTNGRRRLNGFRPDLDLRAQGTRIAVHFLDGELLCGYTLSYAPGRDSFFMLPVDGGSNNLRVYVAAKATLEVRVGDAAESLVIELGRKAA